MLIDMNNILFIETAKVKPLDIWNFNEMYDINKNIHFFKEKSLSHPYKIIIFYSIN